MAARKPKVANNPDDPRPYRIKVSLSEADMRRLDEWRARARRKRADAAAVLIGQALDAATRAASA